MHSCIKFSMPRNDCSWCTSEKGNFCDSLNFLWIGLHAFFPEYGAVQCDFGELFLTPLLLNNKTILAGYLL